MSSWCDDERGDVVRCDVEECAIVVAMRRDVWRKLRAPEGWAELRAVELEVMQDRGAPIVIDWLLSIPLASGSVRSLLERIRLAPVLVGRTHRGPFPTIHICPKCVDARALDARTVVRFVSVQ